MSHPFPLILLPTPTRPNAFAVGARFRTSRARKNALDCLFGVIGGSKPRLYGARINNDAHVVSMTVRRNAALHGSRLIVEDFGNT